MKWDSALELQGEIFRKVLRYEEVAAASAHYSQSSEPVFVDQQSYSAARANFSYNAIAAPPEHFISLGISGAAGSGATDMDDVKLAVLVQDRRLLQSRLVDSIAELGRNEVDVVYIGEQKAMWTTGKSSPLRMGCSTSPHSVNYSGTIGCFARDPSNGKVGILSNNHVLADVNRLPYGTKIIQQGGGDGGHPTKDIVATLSRYVQIQFNGMPNSVDAAFATLDDINPAIDSINIYDGGNPPAVALTLNPGGTAIALPGMDVRKTGRTTLHTSGEVVAVNVNNYMVNMGRAGMVRFDGQIVFDAGQSATTPFSAPGDSGSLIVDANGVPLALLFAGSQSGGSRNLGITAGNPISSVTAQLGISIL